MKTMLARVQQWPTRSSARLPCGRRAVWPPSRAARAMPAPPRSRSSQSKCRRVAALGNCLVNHRPLRAGATVPIGQCRLAARRRSTDGECVPAWRARITRTPYGRSGSCTASVARLLFQRAKDAVARCNKVSRKRSRTASGTRNAASSGHP